MPEQVSHEEAAFPLDDGQAMTPLAWLLVTTAALSGLSTVDSLPKGPNRMYCGACKGLMDEIEFEIENGAH